MSNAAVNEVETAASKQFVILGHGAEDVETPFEERELLPEGYTLVTLAECGAVTIIGYVGYVSCQLSSREAEEVAEAEAVADILRVGGVKQDALEWTPSTETQGKN